MDNWTLQNVGEILGDPFFSQVLWGGAAMLARASFFGYPYSPHPQREKFLARAQFMSATGSAHMAFRQFVQCQRVQLFERLNATGYVGLLSMPPVAAEILQDATSLQDLFQVALQRRKHYRKLRAWLGEFQAALNNEQVAELRKKQQLLDEVSKRLESENTGSPLGETAVRIGYGTPQIVIEPRQLPEQMHHCVGIRAQISQLIFAPGGRNAVSKILRFLGENKTKIGLKLEQELFQSLGSNDLALGTLSQTKQRSNANHDNLAALGPTVENPSRNDVRSPIARKSVQTKRTSVEYEHILKVISHMSQVMERSPSDFASLGEEALRTHILVQLNGHYEGQATGETFNYEGKTDILIRRDGRNLFIAECKFWKGAGAFKATIDQLLGYATWRDTKTAIIIFNRNKALSAVLAQIPDLVRKHPNFKHEIGGVQSETAFRYVLRHRDDAEQELTMTVLVFDVPA